ncbi:MAG: cytochrome c3 family protein [Acidobacteria bacterium]|nr:cytochrome c3 family protein [Acidobacteriota bacterium]MBE3133894.1 cytochrome c3 family protein [Acidobacteriota bacterium]
MRRSVWPWRTLVLLLGVAAGSAVLAQGLPKLPADVTLPQAAESPGKVVFSHQTHVDQAKPDCTTCHPKLFKILDRPLARGTEKSMHAKMEKGAQCGACHNGKDANGLDDCTTCHR